MIQKTSIGGDVAAICYLVVRFSVLKYLASGAWNSVKGERIYANFIGMYIFNL